MTERRAWRADVDGLLSSSERVVTHKQLVAAGMPPSTVTSQIRCGGPWQRALPGVIIAHRGTPTRRERLRAALAYAGPGACVTGWAALREHGVRSSPDRYDVQVLVPHARHRQGHGSVVVERTTTMPPAAMKAGLPVAPVARAAVDACRRTEDLALVRATIAEVVQRRLCSLGQLRDAVRRSARARTGLSRLVLQEVSAGVRSAAEAEARAVYVRTGVPMPLWNADLLEDDGSTWACPDGLWVTLAAVLSIDSMEWHLRPAQYQGTQRRQRDYGERGLLVLPVAPSLVMDDPDEFVRCTLAFLREASKRAVKPTLRVREASAA